MNFNEQPPLPPKSFNRIAPPLPPKLKKPINLKMEEAILLPRKIKSSKVLMKNNNSYTLPNLRNQIIVSSEKSFEQKEAYGNYESKTDKLTSKKYSFLNKIRKFLKKTRKNAQSEINEDFMKKLTISEENKYNDISSELCQINCSNVAMLRQCSSCCCRFCYCIQHHHFASMNATCLNSDRLNTCTTMCESRCNLSTFNSISSEILPNFNGVPILPNRTRRESILSNQSVFQQKPKPPEPPRLPRIDKYSNHVLNNNFRELEKVAWYWGSTSLPDAERVMENRVNGTFLMRDSGQSDHMFTVTFRVNYLTYHARIKFIENKFWWIHNNHGGFDSIVEMIENSLEISKRGEFRFLENSENTDVSPQDISLLNPLSRFNVVSSLKHLTRFIIVTNVRNEHLNWLPLPSHLLSYLHDKEHHYIENFDRFVTIIDSSEQNSSE